MAIGDLLRIGSHSLAENLRIEEEATTTAPPDPAAREEEAGRASRVGELEMLGALLKERVRQQATDDGTELVAKLSEPAAPTTTTAAWPPLTHDKIIKKAFEGLSDRDIEIIQRGSREVDVKYGVPITLLERNAPQHAMTPGSKVWELMKRGLSKEQAVREAQAWARQETAKWIEAKKQEARERLRRGDRDGALRAFGQAMHPVMDNVSPAHRDYQVYDTGKYFFEALKSPTNAVGSFAVDMLSHKRTESRPQTDEEQQLMNEEMWKHFRDVFGEEELQRAMTKRGGN